MMNVTRFIDFFTCGALLCDQMRRTRLSVGTAEGDCRPFCGAFSATRVKRAGKKARSTCPPSCLLSIVRMFDRREICIGRSLPLKICSCVQFCTMFLAPRVERGQRSDSFAPSLLPSFSFALPSLAAFCAVINNKRLLAHRSPSLPLNSRNAICT